MRIKIITSTCTISLPDTWFVHPEYSLRHRPELPRFSDERPSSEAGYSQQIVVVLILEHGSFGTLQMRWHDWRWCSRCLHCQRRWSLRRWYPTSHAAAQVKHRSRMDGEQRAQLRRRLIIHILVDNRAAGDNHLLGCCCRDIRVGQHARRCSTSVLETPFPW